MNILLTLLNVMCTQYTGQKVDNYILLLSNERMRVLGYVVLMHIKWFVMPTVEKKSNRGTLLFIAFITRSMLLKYHLLRSDISSRLSIFARKSWV